MPVDARYLYQLFEPGLVLGIGNPTCGQPVSRLTIPGIGGERLLQRVGRLRNVSAVQPIFSAIELIVAHCDSYSL